MQLSIQPWTTQFKPQSESTRVDVQLSRDSESHSNAPAHNEPSQSTSNPGRDSSKWSGVDTSLVPETDSPSFLNELRERRERRSRVNGRNSPGRAEALRPRLRMRESAFRRWVLSSTSPH